MFERYSCLLILLILSSCAVKKSEPNPILLKPLKISGKNKIFRENPPKVMDIIHTELSVQFDWDKHICMGKEHITLTPYSYDVDSFKLDAKNFEIKNVLLLKNKKPFAFRKRYDKKQLSIYLSESVSTEDTLVLTLTYKAFPDKNIGGGSKAITSDKGLYFINTNKSEPNKPMQLWTQGETESNSNWFVTTDKPFEKMTFGISITVPDSLTTLSNGLLQPNTSPNRTSITGLRTDRWVVKKPMSAYLVMMAVGKFNKTIDKSWQEKEISYYLEDAYHKYAKSIFKHTPEMIEFFSSKMGYPYPWQKYAQVVVRDFVSGAMENTSATLHGDFVQKNSRELLDSKNDGIVAHELFHHWFGDLVTCASWSHLTLNEGFATFGEQLWFGHKYGNTAELKRVYKSMNSYLRYSKRNDKPIIRFHYNDKEELFNPITYQKGARVLNLLKFTLGEKHFFRGVENYLRKYEFKTAQIENLRNELEDVSGKDLRYFFKQWFHTGGHPIIEVKIADDSSSIVLNQTQKKTIFKFPFQYRINNETKTVLCSKRKTKIPLSKEDLANFIYPDPNCIFIGEIKNKLYSQNQLLDYYKAADNYIEKMRILDSLGDKEDYSINKDNLLHFAINDPNADISYHAMRKTNWKDATNMIATKADIKRIATLSTNSSQKSQAIYILAGFDDPLQYNQFSTWSKDSSYKVAAAGLYGINKVKPQKVIQAVKELENDAEAQLFKQVATSYAQHGDSTCTYFNEQLMKRFGSERNHLINTYKEWVKRQSADKQIEFWNIIKERATADENKWTRFNAMKSLHQLANKNSNFTESQRNELLAIMKNEKEGSIKRQLQIQKILPTEKLNDE